MEEASCDKAAYVSTYQENTDDFKVIQGPAARIRPARLPDEYFSCEFPWLPAPALQHHSVACLCLTLTLCLSPPVDYAGLVKNLSVCKVFSKCPPVCW